MALNPAGNLADLAPEGKRKRQAEVVDVPRYGSKLPFWKLDLALARGLNIVAGNWLRNAERARANPALAGSPERGSFGSLWGGAATSRAASWVLPCSPLWPWRESRPGRQ